MVAMIYNPDLVKRESPLEGVAIFIHGTELVLDSICNDASQANPVMMEDVLQGVQWLANIALEYTLRWVDSFCDLDYQVVRHHIAHRTCQYIKGINQRNTKRLYTEST